MGSPSLGREVPARRVLIVDDQPLYCDALAATIQSILSPKVIRIANSLHEALGLLTSRFRPNLVTLNLHLPDTVGISGFLKLNMRLPNIPILVISPFNSDEVTASLLEAGAAGFISKEASRQLLQRALEHVTGGRVFIPPGYTPPKQSPKAKAKAVATKQSQVLELSERVASLTPQQNKILLLMCEGKLNKQIAHDMSLAEATIKAHVTEMFRRLGVQNRTQAALLAKKLDGDHLA